MRKGFIKRFLIWTIPIILRNHHLAKNGSGRKKKIEKYDEVVRKKKESEG